jgi:hypothetical protein
MFKAWPFHTLDVLILNSKREAKVNSRAVFMRSVVDEALRVRTWGLFTDQFYTH